MASKVQICNLALLRINGASITSLTDNTNEAKLCNRLYDDIAEEVMTRGPWSSTIRRSSLARTSNTPTYEFSYEFQLPTNPRCLRVIEINDNDPAYYSFRIEDDKLLANITSISIRYIGFVSDTQSYDTMLKRAIVSRLAAELTYPLTGNVALADRMHAQYERELMEGLGLDGSQHSKTKLSSSQDIDRDVR